MASEEPLETETISSETLPGDSESCPDCGSATIFGIDKNLGYYRRCPKCGHIVNLKRRFLRFDRRSRQWH
jgi:predicted RNA-binding Zn-ribbon protein involved in translation (DUF1610 family)